MAVTWAAAAPHTDAVKAVQAAGLGSAYGTVGSSVFQNLKWPGNKRAVLTKLTATGTYTTGGDAIDETLLGLKQIQAAFIVSSTDSDYDIVPANATDAAGVPLFDFTDTQAVKIKLVDKTAEITAADTVTGYEFHVILVGI